MTITYEKVLDPTTQLELVEQMKNGDKDARDRLILSNMRIVNDVLFNTIPRSVFANSLLTIDDMSQIGCVGLIKGVDTYDPNLGYSLSTYLYKCVTTQLRNALRDYNNKDKNPVIVELKENVVVCELDENIESNVDLLDNLKYLTEKEKEIFISYFVYEKTLRGLAKEYGCTYQNIQAIIKRICKKLRGRMQ